MNAPANIPRLRPEPSEAERAHRAAISMHCTNEGEDAMLCRVALAQIRDQATAGMRRCCDDARPFLFEISRIAMLNVYAPATVAQLWRIRGALTLAMDAARAIERAQRDG